MNKTSIDLFEICKHKIKKDKYFIYITGIYPLLHYNIFETSGPNTMIGTLQRVCIQLTNIDGTSGLEGKSFSQNITIS